MTAVIGERRQGGQFVSDTTYPVPYDMLRKWAMKTPDRVYLRQPVNRVYREKTWAQAHDEVLRLAAAFRALGLETGDVVAILGKNTAEWFITDFAIAAAGLIPAPIYFTAGADTIRYILERSEAKAIILGKLDDLEPARQGIPADVITIAQPYATMPCQHQIADLIARHRPLVKASSSCFAMSDTVKVKRHLVEKKYADLVARPSKQPVVIEAAGF